MLWKFSTVSMLFSSEILLPSLTIKTNICFYYVTQLNRNLTFTYDVITILSYIILNIQDWCCCFVIYKRG